MRIYKFTPSSDFTFIDTGGIFWYTKGPLAGKRFVLIRRDAINCYCLRWTWLRKLAWAILQKFYKEGV